MSLQRIQFLSIELMTPKMISAYTKSDPIQPVTKTYSQAGLAYSDSLTIYSTSNPTAGADLGPHMMEVISL